MTPSQAYEQLTKEVREISLMDSIGSLLGWDQETYLPTKGTTNRAEQQALLARMSHERFTAPRIGELLSTSQAGDLACDAESDSAANIREIKRLYERANKIPAALVEELSRTAVHAQAAWVVAKSRSEFKTFQPWLDKMLKLKREEAQCVGYASNPYDALLDVYEPGETAAGVQKLFDSFRNRLVDLTRRIVESGRKAPVELLERTYPIAMQEKLAREAAREVGFDFEAGRLDLTIHPFCCTIGPSDVRITTRYDERNFADGFFSVLHETGHALYEQGLPKKEYFGLPLGEAISLGIHESQSRMWENLVGRSAAFWDYFFPKVQGGFGNVVSVLSKGDWLFAINDVRPSLIRTEADQTTYNLHVMVRFELEQAMLCGQFEAADVPAAWNEKIKSYLGLTVPDDAHGCLQDVHWSHGSLGYFPIYAMGNLYAAQFFEQARKDVGDLDAMFAKGEFAPLLSWLREKIHRHGKRYSARTLLKRVTGQDLNADAFMRHLETNARNYYGV
ncbi:MAG TPA: carboxypeptidase M32 [Tepidisphaeraceae bacterium]|nr:carboxypeptidase M32 [Tepidisphaeraceae bacterium]